MKNILIIYLFLQTGINMGANAKVLDSTQFPNPHYNPLLYHNMNSQVSAVNTRLDETELANRQLISHFDTRFERMEDKFDRYFLWGYGSLLSILLGGVLWILNNYHGSNKQGRGRASPGKEVELT